MNRTYPLILKPIMLEKIWGGRRLEEVLRKPLPPGAKVGESWEVSDFPGRESIVSNGPFKGTSLRQLVQSGAKDLVGDEAVLQGGRFPLLVKYIDASETLSVQVHPGDEYARQHEGSFGKKEAWYIIHAEPGAKLVRGVTRGATREKFADALKDGELDALLHIFEPKAGDVVMIPWGMVHAIGAGIVLAEVQQMSDVTYRVYDWNRVADKGKPRNLHIAQALDVIEFQPPAADTCERKLLEEGGGKRYEAVRCDRFVLEVLEISSAMADAPPPGRFAILNVVHGDAILQAKDGETRLPLGTTALIPAAMPPYKLRSAGATVLKSYVP